MMATLNDVLFSKFHERGFVCAADLPINATDAEIEAHLNNSTASPPSVAEVRAAIAEYQAEVDAQAQERLARSERAAQITQERVEILASGPLRTLMKASPAQIDAAINAQVTDIASAKIMLARLAKAIKALAGETFE